MCLHCAIMYSVQTVLIHSTQIITIQSMNYIRIDG